MKKVRVLFVCTGNICRSPTAEGVLRKLVADAGLAGQIEVDSCGTIDYHIGEAPTRTGARCAARRGYDTAALRARQIRSEDFSRFDLILGLDRGHVQWLERLSPCRGSGQVALFLDYASDGERPLEVPDPYYGDEGDYDASLDLIEGAMPRLLSRLQREFL